MPKRQTMLAFEKKRWGATSIQPAEVANVPPACMYAGEWDEGQAEQIKAAPLYSVR